MSWQMSENNSLVPAQSTAIAALFWPGRAKWKLPKLIKLGAWAAVIGGGAIAVSGVIEQGEQLTAATTPHKRAKLITSGPYAHSRHPIYVGLLTAASGYALDRKSTRLNSSHVAISYAVF